MTPFDASGLLGDLTVSLDIDVLVGAYPDRDGPDGTPKAVAALLAEHRITAGAVANLRAALFDMESGNDGVHPDLGFVPVGAVDLRDPLVPPERWHGRGFRRAGRACRLPGHALRPPRGPLWSRPPCSPCR